MTRPGSQLLCRALCEGLSAALCIPCSGLGLGFSGQVSLPTQSVGLPAGELAG
jgi:hypothetical protein